VLGKGREEPGGRPALLVGLGGEIGPDELDGGKPQCAFRSNVITDSGGR
jgi:hypothetical protein